MLDYVKEESKRTSIKKRKPRRSIDEWKTLIDAYEKGSLEKTDFCKAHNISVSSLLQWRQKLSSWKRAKSADTRASEFVEIGSTDTVLAMPATGSIELLLPHGMKLIITS